MAANTADIWDEASALNLDNIRNKLTRMEDSIIFGLLERAQFKVNSAVYAPDSDQLGPFRLHQLKSAGSNGCLADWVIYQTECLHSQFRRYLHPTEFPFFGPLPEPYLGRQRHHPAILAPVPPDALVNKELLKCYREKIVPVICEAGDDDNHGSTAVQDMHCLQTMATRIYYGLFVAESKFRTEREKATALIKAKDRVGLMNFITKPEVEARNIQRIVLKARTFSQNISGGEETACGHLLPSGSSTHKINPEFVGEVFRDYLMPLTKDVEVAYLLARLDDEQPA